MRVCRSLAPWIWPQRVAVVFRGAGIGPFIRGANYAIILSLLPAITVAAATAVLLVFANLVALAFPHQFPVQKSGVLAMYAAVTALIFAIVAIVHFVRLIKQWPVNIGPHAVPMSLSWIGLAVSGLLAIWGFMQ